MVRSTAKSTYINELLFPFFKIVYTLIIHYVINFESYNDINFTYLYIRTNYLRHLANIIDIGWSRPVLALWGGGGATPN